MRRSQGWISFFESNAAELARLAHQAIELGKDDPDALWMASYVVTYVGEHSTAASATERALILNPNSAHAWMAMGTVSCFRSQSDMAIDAFQRAIRLSPLDPLGYRFTGGIGIAHAVAGRYEDAISWSDRSLREQPRYTAAMRAMVVSCAHLGRVEEAREWLRRLLEIQPDLTIARVGLYATSFVPAEALAADIVGFRKAGLPEG